MPRASRASSGYADEDERDGEEDDGDTEELKCRFGRFRQRAGVERRGCSVGPLERPPHGGPAEIRDLTKAFNTMAHSVEQGRRSLEVQNEQLRQSERLKSELIISQALVIGDRRPYLVALITLDAEVCPAWATEHGITYTDMTDLSANPKVLEAVAAAVERVNGEMSHAEGIKRWTVLPRDFTLDAEEITPTLKVRRKIIVEKYADAIERLYAR